MKEINAGAKTFAVSIAVAVSTFAALCCLTATRDSAFAQSPGTRPTTSIERRAETLDRQGKEYEIERSSRDMKGIPEKPADRRRAHELEEQVKHDFQGLQESYNQIVLVMADKEGLDRKHNFVLKEVAEIKKYSTRLKTNLALPKPADKKARVETNNEQIEGSLLSLRKHIYDFVTNPLFESPGVLDLEQGRKAGRDLDRIIEISASITKSGDTQKKPN